MQLSLQLPKSYIGSLLNLFIESLLKFNLKYFTLKPTNSKKTLKIDEISVELIRDEEISYHAVFRFNAMQHSPGTT